MAAACAGLLGTGAALAADPTPQAAPAPQAAHNGFNGGRRNPRAMRRMQAFRRNWMRRLSRRLELDKAQRTALRHVHAKAMAGIWAARADEGLRPDQRRVRARGLPMSFRQRSTAAGDRA